MPRTLQLGIGSRHVGKKRGVRKFKKARTVIFYPILGARVIKNRRVKEELPQMKRAEAEKFRHHRIYCGGFLRAPREVRSVVRP